MGVDAFKIGSGEMTDIPTLVRIARLGKPMIISTGMSTIEEIQRTYDVLSVTDTPLAFTNCVSEYPPKYEDINLKFILKMEKHFPDAVIGHSDHTPDLYTSFGAVTLGARIIEKHVILDKRTPGTGSGSLHRFSGTASAGGRHPQTGRCTGISEKGTSG